MSQEIKTFNITLGQVTLNGVVCKDPIIELAGFENAAINCIDPECGLYRVQVAPGDKACLTFIVKCEECDGCPAKIIEYCFCDTIADCDECEECIDGFCVSICEPDEVCDDGQCVGCVTDADCPCNQICKNGKCVCPPNTIENANGCCDLCQNDGDCEVCEECIYKNGYKQCLTKDCPCDDDGSCGALGQCVECIASGDCSGANECCVDCECECCAGYRRLNGVCVPLPPCETDDDCECCEVCINERCKPIPAPAGKVPFCFDATAKECKIVEECDCEDPDCSKITDYCERANANQCGCIPCKGDCDSGCEDPCFCDAETQQCVYDPCEGTCTNGAQCGVGCGCLDGQCTACALLNCDTDECEEALGCICVNDVCVEDSCSNLSCSVASDCPIGCTCYQGRCVSCDNFSCLTNDCSLQDGCRCVNQTCVGDEQVCTDILEMIKNDGNCTLTGRLIKDNCCSCPELTLDSQGKITGESETSYTLDFRVEVRKGRWDGVSANSVPRVDNFSNVNIAENEPPTAGTITFIHQITYDVFEIVNGVEEYRGTSLSTPQSLQSSFIGAGNTAEVRFTGVSLPKIGSRTQDGNMIYEVTFVTIQFVTANSLVFPNQCTYDGGDLIGRYVIDDNSEFVAFGSSYSNTKAAVISTDNCRLPFFKWTKSDPDGSNVDVFRKIYIDGGPTYEDILTAQEGLESCKYYLLDVDCNCKDPISKYIVFCNPENLDFTLSPDVCPNCLTINSFDTCDVNEDKEFYVEFGDQRITWIGDDAPVGQKFCATESFEEIRFGLTCDIENQCTKIYQTNGMVLVPKFSTSCTPDGTEFTVEFEQFDSEGECQIDYVTIGNYNLSGVLKKKIPIGSYTATVYWQCGCDPTEVTVSEDCCDFNISPIARNCDGNVVCKQDPEVIYTVNGVEYTDICNFVEGLDPGVSARIIATKGGCIPIPINLPSLDSFCCENFSLRVQQTSPTTAIVTVLNGTGNTIVTVDGGATATVNSDGTWSISGLVDGESYNITATDETCESEDINIVAGKCELLTTLEITSDCKLRASINPQACECRLGTYTINILNVVDVGTRLQVFYDTFLSGFDSIPIEGELRINDNPMGAVEPDGYFFLDKPTAPSAECINSNMTIKLGGSTTSPSSLVDVEIILKQGSTNVKDLPNVSSVSITVNDQNTQTEVQSDGETYLFPLVATGFTSIVTVTVTVIDTDGFTYVFYHNNSYNQGQSVNIVSPICKAATENVFQLPVEFNLVGLKLEDDCDYYDVAQSFMIKSNGIISPTPIQVIPLDPEIPTARDVKFTWYKNDEFVWYDFDEVESILPDEYLEQGNDYAVVADCPPCSDTDKLTYCCVPELTYVINGCNDCVTFTLTGVPGQYQIDFNGASTIVDIPVGETSVSVTLSCEIPIEENASITATVSVVGTSCQEDFTVNTVLGISPTFSFPACSGGLYSILITNASPTWRTHIMSGSGTVAGNGYDIININEADAPIFQITDEATGCETVAYYGARPVPCSVSSSVPVSSSEIADSSSARISSGAPSSSRITSSSRMSMSSSGNASSSGVEDGFSSSAEPSSSITASSSEMPSSSNQMSSSTAMSSSRTASSSNTVIVVQEPSSSRTPSSSKVVSSSRVASSSKAASSSHVFLPSKTSDISSSRTASSSKVASSSKAPAFPPSTGGGAASSSAFGACAFAGQACGNCGICRPLPGESGPPYYCQPNESITCDPCYTCGCVGTQYCDCKFIVGCGGGGGES